ncbi:LEAF RUST 10 DISEASE-RESISTANCE LOCUS RECEPTOR-LIKE PROTEIN KINASE-LIKE 1.4 [Salix purpurea]|uniref:LEAF RUST 10 DISEASE-RESISTANCE LOCUS RECEPTOR-LIKE PROTEIN KINASE-LIKE 1.4 n=1 Tax=Salix purpurea TaxID=77065 RepID=A0A9Q0WG03_SALPP|nr:LEAF RUST 10 DISEASE-RESISTANCE LOCUS RECEPTOR-LIKE PROTEIN KINASE-LIKE 1.4 [Salix purpurea]
MKPFLCFMGARTQVTLSWQNFNFSCPGPEYSEEEGFFMIGNHVSDPRFMDKCHTSFHVPFLLSRAKQLQAKGSSLLVEVLKEEFDVHYSNPYSADCQKCYKHSGGQCGFDGKPICICDDQLCPGTGSSRFGGGRKIAIGE